MKFVRLSALDTSRFYPQEIILVLMLEAESPPGRYMSMKKFQ